jgi:HAD superfamily hydrolase (TIGR01484 family)
MFCPSNSEIFTSKKIIAFDVDGTLSESRAKIDSETADILHKLLKVKKVAIITGGAFADIERQVLSEIGLNNELNKNLILLPTNGGGFYTFDGGWIEISSHKLTAEEKEKVVRVLGEIDQADPELRDNKSFGREIQDRESEITYAALGEHAPLALKTAWDPDFKKRIALQKKLMERLPEFEVKIGGKTSIDITPKGMDKAYGVKKLMDYFKLDPSEVLFFGDAVYENGNDYPVHLMEVDTIRVCNPEETKERLLRLLAGKPTLHYNCEKV